MCTETFLRLPEEKRTRILDAAWQEFTAVPFSGASINQIVHRAGIPRGSFYQYFADKRDLFVCLIEDMRSHAAAAAVELMERSGGDIFQGTLLAFDDLVSRRDGPGSPLLERCIQVLRINPGMDIEGMMTGERDADSPERYFFERLSDKLDLSRLRRQDEAFAEQVCCLAAACFCGVMMDSLAHMDPERDRRNREKLIGALDIIRRGSERTKGEIPQ